MKPKHNLLKRQIKKYFGDSFAFTSKCEEFIDAVNNAYVQSDVDRCMLERSLDLSSQELLQANSEMRNLISLLNATIESTADGILVVDRDGHIVSFNNKFLEMWRIPRSIVESEDNAKALASAMEQLKDSEAFLKKMMELYAEPEAESYDVLEFRDGRVFERYSQPQRIEGKSIGRVWSFHDITGRRQAENALRESEEKYRSLVHSTEDSIYLVDRDYKYLFMNERHVARMGFSGDEYLGRSFSEFHSSEDTKWFVEKVGEVFSTGKSVQHEHTSANHGGYFLLTLSPVKKPDGAIVAVTVISKDISRIKSMEAKLRTLSLTDELTGLYNRRGFFTLSEQLLKQVRRQKIGIFVVYADVDHLKEINDKWGHQEGDMALIHTADVLRGTFRESDIIARIGGDEFVVLAMETAKTGAEKLENRLQSILNTYNAKNQRYELSLSRGVAYCSPECLYSIDELLIQGDQLMYEQKKSKAAIR